MLNVLQERVKTNEYANTERWLTSNGVSKPSRMPPTMRSPSVPISRPWFTQSTLSSSEQSTYSFRWWVETLKATRCHSPSHRPLTGNLKQKHYRDDAPCCVFFTCLSWIILVPVAEKEKRRAFFLFYALYASCCWTGADCKRKCFMRLWSVNAAFAAG